MAAFGLKEGFVPLIIGIVAILVLLAVTAYASYSMVLIIVAAAVATVIILHFRNKRPVKLPGDDVRLNLDGDGDGEVHDEKRK